MERATISRICSRSVSYTHLRLTLQDLGRVGALLTRQRDCLVNLLRLLTYASNEEALDDTNSCLLYTSRCV